MSGDQIWNEIATSIRDRIGQLRFNLWFRDLTVVAFEGDTLTVGVPDALHRAWLLHRYVPILEEAARDSGQDVSLDLALLPPSHSPIVSNEPSVRVLSRAAR
jgi:hypothetical protein